MHSQVGHEFVVRIGVRSSCHCGTSDETTESVLISREDPDSSSYGYEGEAGYVRDRGVEEIPGGQDTRLTRDRLECGIG